MQGMIKVDDVDYPQVRSSNTGSFGPGTISFSGQKSRVKASPRGELPALVAGCLIPERH